MLVRFSLALVVILMPLCAAQGADTGSPPRFDGERARQYVAHLSQDSFEGRMSCTAGYRQAAEWAAGLFQSWGLQPAGENDTYFQAVKIPAFDWHTGIPALQVGSREFPPDDADFSLATGSTPGVRQQAEVVFVGYGIAAPDKGLNEYDGVDIKGKVVLVLRGSPQDAPAPSGRFLRTDDPAGKESKTETEPDWKDQSTDDYKIKTAYDQGAAAILLYDPNESAES